MEGGEKGQLWRRRRRVNHRRVVHCATKIVGRPMETTRPGGGGEGNPWGCVPGHPDRRFNPYRFA